MANYGPPPGSYGIPPAFPPFAGLPPGVAAPPGMPPLAGQPPFDPSKFQLPAGIDPTASVIRFGGQNNRAGLGSERRDHAPGDRGRGGQNHGGRSNRETHIHALTKEEVWRTIYVGGLVDGMPNEGVLQDILGIGHGLRRWTRVTDADEKPLDFGFAEYEDAVSLAVAKHLITEVEVPLRKDGQVVKDEADAIQFAKFTVTVDPQSTEYIEQWATDENKVQFKIDTAQDELRNYISQYKSGTITASEQYGGADGPVVDYANQAAQQAELLDLPSADDELLDIPVEQREAVIKEIAAFRTRSNKRDEDRLKEEEEVAQKERERFQQSRFNRLASPSAPASAPTGPAKLNGVSHSARALSNKVKALRIPKDYVHGADDVEDKEEGDAELSDDELERRRQAKRDEALEKIYLEQERKWLQKEKSHFAAVERQQQDEKVGEDKRQAHRASLAQQLEAYDDESEEGKKHLFYANRERWTRYDRDAISEERHRDQEAKAVRERARKDEEKKRMQREREARQASDRGMRDNEDHAARRAPSVAAAKPKFSFGLRGDENGLAGNQTPNSMRDDDAAAAASLETTNLAAGAPDLGIMEDEEDADVIAAKDRKAGGLSNGASLHHDKEASSSGSKFKPLAPASRMTEDEHKKASNEIARSIPANAEALFAWEIKWDTLPDSLVREQLRPYIERKVMEAIGVQEDLLVGRIERIILDHGSSEQVMRALEEILDDESEMVAKKIWKMVVFYSESAARGLLD